MKSLILKYNWLCLALVCCAIFVACEPAEVATKEKAIAFKNGQVRAIAEEEANARLFAYRIAEDAEIINALENGKDLRNVVLADSVVAGDSEGFKKELDINGVACTIILNKVAK